MNFEIIKIAYYKSRIQLLQARKIVALQNNDPALADWLDIEIKQLQK